MLNRTSKSYNALYNTLRAKISNRNLSFALNTFFDGSALISVKVALDNVEVILKLLIIPEFDKDDDNIVIKWRIVDESGVQYAKNIDLCAQKVNNIVQQTRLLMNKI